MRKERIDINPAIGNKPSAVPLPNGRERPGTDDRDLATQHIWTDINCDVAALTYVTRLSPSSDTLNRLFTSG